MSGVDAIKTLGLEVNSEKAAKSVIDMTGDLRNLTAAGTGAANTVKALGSEANKQAVAMEQQAKATKFVWQTDEELIAVMNKKRGVTAGAVADSKSLADAQRGWLNELKGVSAQTRANTIDLGAADAAYEKHVATMKDVETANKQVTDSTREIGVAHTKALAINAQVVDGQGNLIRVTNDADKAINKLRPSMVALASQATNTAGPIGTMTSTLLTLAGGSALTLGVAAGIGAIGIAVDKLTQKQQAERKATDESIAALKKWYELKNAGDAGEFGLNVARDAAELKKQVDEMVQLKKSIDSQQNQRPSASLADDMGGFSFFANAELTATRKRFAELGPLVREGRANVAKIENEADADRLAKLAQNNQLTAAQYAQARIVVGSNAKEIARLQSEISKTFNPDRKAIDEVLRLTEQNKKLTDSLDPVDKAAKKSADELARLAEHHAKTVSTGRLQLDLATELTAAFGKTAREIEDINEAYALKTKVAAIDTGLTKAQQAEQADVITKTHEQAVALRTLQRAEEDRQNVFKNLPNIRSLTNIAVSGETKAAEVRSVDAAAASWTRYAKAVADANAQKVRPTTIMWDDSLVKSAEKTLGIAADIARTLKIGGEGFANTIASAAGGMQNILSSVSKASQSGATSGDKLAAGGAIIGGIYAVGSAIADSWKPTTTEATKAAQALRELRDAAKASVAQYKLQAGGSDLEQTLYNLKTQYSQIRKDLIAAGGVDPEGRSASRKIGVTDQDFIDAKTAYEKLVKAAVDAAKDAHEQLQREQSIQRAMDAEDSRRRTAGYSIDSQAFTDPRGAADRRAAEEANNRLWDAVQRGAKEGELAEIERYNRAAETNRLMLQAEQDRRSIASNMLEAIGFNDPRAAGRLSVIEDANNRLWDAIQAGATEAEQAAIRLRNAAALANYETRLLEQDRRTTEGLVSTGLGLMGAGRKGEDLSRLFSNRQALNDAESRGDTPFNIDLLKFTQRLGDIAVNFQRAVDDETKRLTDKANNDVRANDLLIETIQKDATERSAKIDKQIEFESRKFDQLIAASQAAVQFAQQQVQVSEQLLGETKRSYDALYSKQQSFGLSDASSLSPADRFALAQKQFDEQLGLARGGDRNAAANFGTVFDNLLKEARTNYASGTGFTNVEGRSKEALDSLTKQYGGLVDEATQRRDNAVRSLEVQQSMLQSLQEQKTAVIEKLQEQKAAIQSEAQRSVEQLQDLNKGIREQLPIDIATRTAELMADRDKSIGLDSFLPAFKAYLETGAAPENYGSPAKPVTVAAPTGPTPGETAIETAVGKVETVLGNALQTANTQVLRLQTIIDDQRLQVDALAKKLDAVVTAVNESADTIRRSVSRATVNT